MIKYPTEVEDRPGKQVAEGIFHRYNVIKVLTPKSIDVYSLQMGRWVKCYKVRLNVRKNRFILRYK